MSCLSATLLSGCDMLDFANPFADSRPKQEVPGARHVPILNESYLGHAQPSPPPVAAAISPASPPAPAKKIGSYDTDPFDYYDNEGNRITPEGAAPEASTSSSSGGFFSHVFGNGKAADDNNAVRKPLSANPYYQKSESEPANGPAPLLTSSRVAVPPPANDPSEPVQDSPSQTKWLSQLLGPETAGGAQEAEIAQEDFQKPQEKSADAPENPSGKPSWISHLLGRDKAAQNPEQAAPYPPLSSVPPTPSEFESAKKAKAQEMQELQDDRAGAAQEKEQLDSEPSAQQAITPPPASTVPSAPAAPQQPAAPSSSNAPASDTPVLLGHVAAPDTDSISNVPVSADEPPAAAPGAAPPAEPAAPAAASLPTPLVTPPSGTASTTPPAMAPAEAEPSSGASQPAAASNENNAALPSPQMLQDVKLLPPSRYSERDRAMQQPASDY